MRILSAYSRPIGNAQVQYVAIDLGVEQVFDDGNHYKAPMNGTVIDVLVSAGDR